MNPIPYTQEAYQLLHNGAIALAQVEANGIRIDTEYIDTAMRRLRRRTERLKWQLQDMDVGREWTATFKTRTNLDSTDQLGNVLFDVMGYHCPARTKTGKYKTDEKTLAAVDIPFVKQYLKWKKFTKAMNTYLKGIKREVVDGFIHPSFNLHLVKTYRSSSDSPNFQNQPIRDPQLGKVIRQAFVPRPGCILAELDYSGIEVCIAATYHQDPTMLEYLEDPTKDMHRDMAMQCFKLPLSELSTGDKRAKNIRYCGKNMFVFPQFYGDWYISCAQDLWTAIASMGLTTSDGLSLYEHLTRKGIAELGDLDSREKPRKGTFERHIQQVERDFWSKRFPVYAQWKRDWVEDYRERGWMLTKTGFICQGWSKKNEIINYPVQGSAFHCLLWALIRLQERLKEGPWQSKIVGQIHDSLLVDVPERELDGFLNLAREVMVEELLDEWDWINVPIEIEAEITPVDGNWYQKEEIEL